MFKRCPQFDAIANSLSSRVPKLTNEGDVRTSLRKYFDYMNLNELGSGCYAKVYVSWWNRRKVIKVGHNVNDGWLKYAAFCIEHEKDNIPYLPKIHNLKVFNNFYIALLDRYTNTLETLDIKRSKKFDRVKSQWKAIRAAFFRTELELNNHYSDAMKLKKLLDDEQISYSDLCVNNAMYIGDKLIITDPCSAQYKDKSKLQSLGIAV